VHLDEALDQREADAEAPLRSNARLRSLRKEVEHTPEHVGGDADASVGDGDDRLLTHGGDAQTHLACVVGVPRRVVEQVGDGLCEANGCEAKKENPRAPIQTPSTASGTAAQES
jgi:hypothetical protein